ncbi:MAG: hypothetical protein H2069_09615 [Legionella sp.]|nr:hypothetical protein [Legionella sp.]
MTHGERIADPANYYECPALVLQDESLSKAEQIVALINWRDDIDLRLLATAENMGGNADDLSLVREINDLLFSLKKTTH